MLTADEQHEIEAEMQRYPDRHAVTIDALKIVQRRRGWVTDEALNDVAEFLGISPHDLDGVATFYNLIYRQPVGRHVILLCDSVSCWIRHYQHLRRALNDRLGIDFGETTADGRFTLLPIVCLGACDHAPVLMIDEDLHRDVTVEAVAGILAEYP